MINQNDEIARQRIAERIRISEARAQTTDPDADGGARHHFAAALRRVADRLEPPRRRTELSFGGR